MFQTFDTPSTPDQGPARLALLHKWMADEHLDGYLIPRADRHQGEYVAPCDDRLAWLTGFTGSAGFAAILCDHAGVFVDGRYRVQVRNQVADVFTPVPWPDIGLAQWLRKHANPTATIGYDP
ncbi:MAG: aminopeptidase P family N-terminal domain-containing protein, partial [Pseudomonadota bacterium]